MSSDDFDSDYDWLLAPKRFDVLLDLAERPDRIWNHLDLGELLQAQLNLPLPQTKPARHNNSAKACIRASLIEATTPFSELASIKDWAKEWSRDAAGPRDVALVIYLSAIASTLVHHGRSATRLSAESLSRQFTWALAQQWIDPELRELLRRGSDAITP